jgi:hypothetical protein
LFHLFVAFAVVACFFSPGAVPDANAQGKGLKRKPSPPPIVVEDEERFRDDFESYGEGRWYEGSRQGIWEVAFDGGGPVGVVSTPRSKVLQLESAVPTHAEATHAALVTTIHPSTEDLDFSIKVRTVSQLRENDAPNPWEVAWVCWNYQRLDQDVVRFYYVAIKPNGFELGKVDQSVFQATGGQRFLSTDERPLDLDTWHDVRISQVGSRLRVWVNGEQRADFTDGQGSGGFPAWGSPGESVFVDGKVCLYEEDAVVQFDDFVIYR